TPHIVLLADENELSRRRMIIVFEEVVHPQPEIFQAKLAKVFARDGERVEIVLVEVLAKLASPFLVFSPQKTERQKEQRYNDRSDDVDRKLALNGINHNCASNIHARRLYDTRRPKAMRRHIALRKHFPPRRAGSTKSPAGLFASPSFGSAYASSRRFRAASQISNQTGERNVFDQRIH